MLMAVPMDHQLLHPAALGPAPSFACVPAVWYRDAPTGRAGAAPAQKASNTCMPCCTHCHGAWGAGLPQQSASSLGRTCPADAQRPPFTQLPFQRRCLCPGGAPALLATPTRVPWPVERPEECNTLEQPRGAARRPAAPAPDSSIPPTAHWSARCPARPAVVPPVPVGPRPHVVPLPVRPAARGAAAETGRVSAG